MGNDPDYVCSENLDKVRDGDKDECMLKEETVYEFSKWFPVLVIQQKQQVYTNNLQVKHHAPILLQLALISSFATKIFLNGKVKEIFKHGLQNYLNHLIDLYSKKPSIFIEDKKEEQKILQTQMG